MTNTTGCWPDECKKRMRLSSRAQSAAERHLSGFAACRQALITEQQTAQSLSDKLRNATASLQLPPEFEHRVLAALADEHHYRTIVVNERLPASRARLE
jgi:hypothetical protein